MLPKDLVKLTEARESGLALSCAMTAKKLEARESGLAPSCAVTAE